MADHEEWISTGLYLSPGMKTDIEFPPHLVGKNWMVSKKYYGHFSHYEAIL